MILPMIAIVLFAAGCVVIAFFGGFLLGVEAGRREIVSLLRHTAAAVKPPLPAVWVHPEAPAADETDVADIPQDTRGH